MPNKFLIGFAFTLVPFMSYSQSVTITQMEIQDKKFIIHYEIDDSNPNNEYLVNIYSSTNKFSAPLTKVSGAVGEEVKPGENTAVWDILEELGEYEGSLSLEIRATVFIPFVRLTNFKEGGKFKKGKQAELEWRPGNTNPVHIELLNENTRVQGELNHPNNGNYTISFGKDLKPGSKYRIKITDSRQSDNFVFSAYFKVKPKVPLLVKIIPAIGLGYLLFQSGGGTVPEEVDNTLPTPPGFPNG